MNTHRGTPRLIGATVALALLFVLMPARASAQSPGTPGLGLPLPDVILYGATNHADTPLTSGTVRALLPRGGIVSAPIDPMGDTGYSYVLPLPLRMYDSDTGVYDADSVIVGDTITLQINGSPATWRGDQGITQSEFTIPPDGAGQTYVLNLDIDSASAYPMGDVNGSGIRDAADALLVLKYDIGLIGGSETSPPTPGTICLPLCDIVADGVCNSVDALRILQCDVGMPGVECPGQSAVSQSEALLEAASEPLDTIIFRTQVEVGAEPDLFTGRLVAVDQQGSLGAASLELHYSRTVLAAESCRENPDGLLDVAACNTQFQAGAVRFAGATINGVQGEIPLAEVTFRLTDPDAAAAEDPISLVSKALMLVADGVFDREGYPLGWGTEGIGTFPRCYLPLFGRFEFSSTESEIVPPDEGAEEVLPDVVSLTVGRSLYLPLLTFPQYAESYEEQLPSEEPPVLEEPTPVPDEEVEEEVEEPADTSAESAPELNQRLYVPVLMLE